MDHEDAQQLALDLMDEHRLDDWAFRWGRGKRTLGSCNYTTKTITLSIYYVEMNDAAHVRDTILHEIAHALAGRESGHGSKWKEVCRAIGADPTRVDHTAKLPDAPYEIVCTMCERVVASRHRRVRAATLKRMGCRACGRPSLGRLDFRSATESSNTTRV